MLSEKEIRKEAEKLKGLREECIATRVRCNTPAEYAENFDWYSNFTTQLKTLCFVLEDYSYITNP